MENLMIRLGAFLRNNWILILIIFLGLIVRVIYLIVLQPPLTWSDASLYDSTAWNLINGNGYSMQENIPFAGREPGYALFFLTPIYFIFGHNVLAVQIFQIILSLFIILFIYLITKEYLNRQSALLAAFFYSILPADIAFSSEVLTEIPFTFLLIISIWLLLRAVKKDSLKWIFISGLILGMATLTRFISIFLPLAFLIVFILFFKSYGKAFKYFLLIFLGVLIFVAPWFLRNYLQFDRFVFGRAGSWQMYWSGSYIAGDGEWTGYRPPLTDLIKGKDIFEDDEILQAETIKNIKENPSGVAKIWLKKPFKVFLRSVSYGQVAHSKHLDEVLQNKPLLGFALKGGLELSHFLTVLLFIFGMTRLFLNKTDNSRNFFASIILSLLCYFIVFLLPLNPDSRYQVPVMPYFIMGASFGILSVINILKGWNKSFNI